MKAVITVVGKDRVGIIAGVSRILADNGVNILDISQTIMREMFTMIMLVNIGDEIIISKLSEKLSDFERKWGLPYVFSTTIFLKLCTKFKGVSDDKFK